MSSVCCNQFYCNTSQTPLTVYLEVARDDINKAEINTKWLASTPTAKVVVAAIYVSLAPGGGLLEVGYLLCKVRAAAG